MFIIVSLWLFCLLKVSKTNKFIFINHIKSYNLGEKVVAFIWYENILGFLLYLIFFNGFKIFFRR